MGRGVCVLQRNFLQQSVQPSPRLNCCTLKQDPPRHNNDFAYGPSRQRFVMHVGSRFGDLSSNFLPQQSILSFQTKSLSFQCTHVIMHNNLFLLSSHNYLTLDGESRLDVHWCFYLSLLPKESLCVLASIFYQRQQFTFPKLNHYVSLLNCLSKTAIPSAVT